MRLLLLPTGKPTTDNRQLTTDFGLASHSRYGSDPPRRGRGDQQRAGARAPLPRAALPRRAHSQREAGDRLHPRDAHRAGRAGAPRGAQLPGCRHRLRRRNPAGRHRRALRRHRGRNSRRASVAVAGRVVVAAHVRSRRLRGRLPAPHRARARSYLVVLAALRPQHLSLDPAQHSQIVHRLADLVLLPHPRARVHPHPATPGVAAPHVCALLAQHLGEARYLRGDGDGRRHRAQGAEQRSHRDEAGAAGAPACCRRAWKRCKARSIRTFCSTR